MTNFSEFQVGFDGHHLCCDWCGSPIPDPLVILHGAGKGTRDRFAQLRSSLFDCGFTSVSLDFIGHGQTGGELSSSSLVARTRQAECLIKTAKLIPPLNLLGSSMGAYNAIKLTEIYPVSTLVLFVPGVYKPEAYSVPFGPHFSELIRTERSWESTDAWRILEKFEGRLLVVAAGQDTVIPSEIPQRLYEAASQAHSRELYWVEDSSHLLVHYLNENPKQQEIVRRKIELLLRGK